MSEYLDDDLIYVDPTTRTVVGKVQMSADGTPMPMEQKTAVVEKDDNADEGKGKRKRILRKRNYPWGTYRTMKKIYRLEGKERHEPSDTSLDEVIVKAMEHPYWD